jgi:hypothetical protein
MAFYPTETQLNTVNELKNISHNITYVETLGASGIGGSVISYPVIITTAMPNQTITIDNATIQGYYSDAFDNEISYRTVDDKFITVTHWIDIAYAIANETLSELYYYKADTTVRKIYSYTATASNGDTQTYTVNVDNDWLSGRNQLIKYTNLDRYQQKILVEWINNNADKVNWLNNVVNVIDWENSLL